MRPRPFEQGYLAVLAKHSAGRRPAVSSARVWRGSSVLAACGGASDDSKWASVERRRQILDGASFFYEYHRPAGGCHAMILQPGAKKCFLA